MSSQKLFTARLYDILSDVTLSSTICWNSKGTSFQIRDRSLLGPILSEHFQHSNVNSFLRQLSLYGFKMHKINKIKEYSHKWFYKGCNNFTRIQRSVATLSKDRLLEIENAQLFRQLEQFKQNQLEILNILHNEMHGFLKLQMQIQDLLKIKQSFENDRKEENLRMQQLFMYIFKGMELKFRSYFVKLFNQVFETSDYQTPNPFYSDLTKTKTREIEVPTFVNLKKWIDEQQQ